MAGQWEIGEGGWSDEEVVDKSKGAANGSARLARLIDITQRTP
jgi:hypothetical protein